MNFSPAEIAALRQQPNLFGLFFRLMTPDPVRLFLGIGDIAPGVNSLELEGFIYNGAGRIANMPPLQQLINGTAEQIEFSLSGITPEFMTIASSVDVLGVEVNVGIALFSPNWTLIDSIKWIRTYYADYISTIEQSPADPAGTVIRKIALTASGAFMTRRRSRNSYWTDDDQRARSPTDNICDKMSQAPVWSKAWPPPPDPP